MVLSHTHHRQILGAELVEPQHSSEQTEHDTDQMRTKWRFCEALLSEL